MMLANLFGLPIGVLVMGALLLASASCTLIEERIDRAAGGPNVPADPACEQ
jgi:hypothetical protein